MNRSGTLTATQVREELESYGAAIRQLEGDQKELWRKLPRAAPRLTQQPDSQYRGVFPDEQSAREFGLLVLASELQPDRAAVAAELCRREFGSVIQRDMTSNPDSGGGGAIPTEFNARVRHLMEQGGTFFRNAFKMPMSTNSLIFLKQVGELTVYVPGENAAPTASDPGFQNVTLNEKEWCTLTYYPRSLGEDAAVDIGEIVAKSVFYSFALKGDHIAFNGDSTPTYFGQLGIIPKLVKINGVDDGGGIVVGSGNLWSELTLEDFERVQARVPDYAGAVNKWYCSKRFYYEVMVRLATAAGGVTAAEVQGKRTRMFLGDDVEFVSVMPKTPANSQVCALNGDMALTATWGDRRVSSVEESRDYRFAERQVTVLGTTRVAISIDDVGDATEPGPMVGLMTAAS